MGLIDFVKSAGAKLFGADEAEKPAAGAAAEPVSMARIRELQNKKRAAKLVETVNGLGLKVSNLAVEVEDDCATVGGICTTQAEREKVVLAVGNTNGIARVDDRLEVESPEPEAVYYTVVKGDTLSKIAKQHYGSASKYPVIFEANKPLLSDPDKIYPGQVLRIPPLAG